MTSLPGKFFNERTYYLLQSERYDPNEPVVVCVHGIGSYHVHFEGLSAALVKEGFTVLSFDFMGRGHSPFPTNLRHASGKSIFGKEGHLEVMRELIVGLGIDRRKFHLIGHSMGGAVASLYASAYGEHELLSLTLLSPAGLIDLGPVSTVRSCTCLHGLVRNILRNNSENAFRADFHQHKGAALEVENKSVETLLAINRQYPHIFEAFWQCVLHFPLSGNEAEIASLAKHHHIRTMIMWADQDKAVPKTPSMNRYLNLYRAANHPSVETKVFQNAGHGFFLEYADEFHADMIRFLKNVDATKADKRV